MRRVRLTLNQSLQRPREQRQLHQRHIEQMPERLVTVPAAECDEIPNGLDPFRDRNLRVGGNEPGEV